MGAPHFLKIRAADRYHAGTVQTLELCDNHGQRELRVQLEGVAEGPGSVCLLLTRAQCLELAEHAERLALRSAD